MRKVVILRSAEDAKKIASHLYNVDRANNHLIFSDFDPSAFKCVVALEGLNEKSYEYFVGTILLEVKLSNKLYSLKLPVKRRVSGNVDSSGYDDFTLFLTPEVLSMAEIVQNFPNCFRWQIGASVLDVDHTPFIDIDYVAFLIRWNDDICNYHLFISDKKKSGLFSLFGVQQFTFEDV
jgi:hypothetical protein